MSDTTSAHHIIPLYVRASAWRDGDPYEVALVNGQPHRRARGPIWVDRLMARGDQLLGHTAHHYRVLAQITLLVGVVAWWVPGVVATALMGPVLVCWGYVAIERTTRRWVRWVPIPWDDDLYRYAARAAAAQAQAAPVSTTGAEDS